MDHGKKLLSFNRIFFKPSWTNDLFVFNAKHRTCSIMIFNKLKISIFHVLIIIDKFLEEEERRPQNNSIMNVLI